MKKLIAVCALACTLITGTAVCSSGAEEAVTDLLTDGSGTDENEEVVMHLVSLAETPEEKERREIVDFALQFVGNPYVYGGTSLTGGADCSGFVYSVFAEFGYSLPRASYEQYSACSGRDISELEPGDLVFYGPGGSNHVALYIGDGQVVHAANARLGIVVSEIDYTGQPSGAGTFLE